MFQDFNKWRVLGVFFDDPQVPGYQLREISRLVRLAPVSVKRYLAALEKGGLIHRVPHRVTRHPTYVANTGAEQFRFYKKINTITRIHDSGVVEFLRKQCLPSCIILFGSAARGEDVKESDIDIFLECKRQQLDLKQFERTLKRKISLLFSPSLTLLSLELQHNLINGVILHGYVDFDAPKSKS